MTNWSDVGNTVQSFATAAAIVVGGAFTYFKFVKDRVFRPRVDLELDAEVVVDRHGVRFVVCHATVHNMGHAKLAIRHDGAGPTEGTAIVVRLGEAGPGAGDATFWAEIDESVLIDVFEQHDWLESGETIRDEVVIRMSSDESSTYRVELWLVVANPVPFRHRRIDITTARVLLPTVRVASIESSPVAERGENCDATMG